LLQIFRRSGAAKIAEKSVRKAVAGLPGSARLSNPSRCAGLNGWHARGKNGHNCPGLKCLGGHNYIVNNPVFRGMVRLRTGF
jgi:hypothetical protein